MGKNHFCFDQKLGCGCRVRQLSMGKPVHRQLGLRLRLAGQCALKRQVYLCGFQLIVHLVEVFRELVLAEHAAAEPDALAHRHEVRRRVEPRAKPVPPQDRLAHRAC